ncbi:MAG: DUF4403 family protein [Chitinophagales bacterium]|nr:DUF4403 family protein [Chitinophagales bacterium]
MENNNHIHINLHISKEGINQFLNDYMQQYSQHKIESESYEITLNKSKSTDLNIQASENAPSVIVDIPLDFTFYKKAGLFSVEGEGGISVRVEIAYDIHADLSYSTKCTLLDHQWTQKPIVHLGTLNIPVEILSDCIIHFMKEGVLTKLDDVIQEQLDLKAMIQAQWLQYASNFLLLLNPKVYFNADLKRITSLYLKSDSTHLNLDLYFGMDIKLSDRPLDILPEFNPKFGWMTEQVQHSIQEVHGAFSYKSLAKLILSEINEREIGGKKIFLDSIHIAKSAHLEIKANMDSPFEGIITITCIPVLDADTQKIDLKDLHVKVSANNIIYRMASPIIESGILKKLQEVLPFALSPIADTYIKKVPTIQLFNNRISLIPSLKTTKLESFQLHEDHLSLIMLIDNPEVGIVA